MIANFCTNFKILRITANKKRYVVYKINDFLIKHKTEFKQNNQQ